LSRRKTLRVDASATWCWKHLHTTPHTRYNSLKGFSKLHVEAPPSSAASLAAGITYGTNTKQKPQASVVYGWSTQHNRRKQQTGPPSKPLAHALKSNRGVESGALIGCAPIPRNSARHAHWSRAVSLGRNVEGREGPGEEDSLFLFQHREREREREKIIPHAIMSVSCDIVHLGRFESTTNAYRI
jgi:hypothetical protein